MSQETAQLQADSRMREYKSNLLYRALTDLEKALSEVESSSDSLGASATAFTTVELELILLRIDEAKNRIDEARKVLNRNRTSVCNALSKQLLSKNIDEVAGRSFWGPPSKKKDPEAYKRFCDMLVEKYGSEGVDIKTEIVINGEELSALCDRLQEEGQPDLPDVQEYNELTIKTRKLRK